MTNTSTENKVRYLLQPARWATFLFWSWNLIFLAFVLLGFAPTILPELRAAIETDLIPPVFLLYGSLLTLIPVVAVLLGWLLRRRPSWQLLALGYGVEAPLMLVLALRFFVVREATPPVTLLLLGAAAGIFFFLWQLLDPRSQKRGATLSLLQLVGLTLLLLTGLYASIWISFYVVPLLAQAGNLLAELAQSIGSAIRSFRWEAVVWQQLAFFVLGTTLLAYTATLFVLMPLAIAIFYTRAWWQTLRRVWQQRGPTLSLGTAATTTFLFALLFVLANRQPQQRAFALLEEPPATEAEAEALLAREDEIRAGLLNSYLAPVRYVSAVGEVQHVSRLYRWQVGVSDPRAWQVQRLYEVVARPVLYQPITPLDPWEVNRNNRRLQREPAEAAALYQQFFDQPIDEGEHAAVVQAVRSTWSAEQASTNWRAIDHREVLLARQEVTVNEAGDWATGELYEVYQNQTGQRQEVVYYFSLPESAVITGLWLGNSADRAQRFPFHVAPRGAAQATYRREVRRSMDPALLEQIGPNQYRLRIFPVQPQRWEQNEEGQRVVKNGPPLHLWLTWQVLLGDEGWALPHLARKFNVYWDQSSVRLLNGAPLDVPQEQWLPPSVPASTRVEGQSHQVDFAGGQSVRFRPLSNGEALKPAPGSRFAVVLDRSRSMEALAGEVEGALAALAADAEVDVYLTSSPYLGAQPRRVSLSDLDLAEVVYSGGQNAAQLLAQFAGLQGDATYDAILVLTDGTGYETGDPGIAVPVPDAPVWMVHLGGNFPMGYDDPTLAAIQASGGGAVATVEEALARVAVAARPTAEGTRVDIADGYLWETQLAPAGSETAQLAQVSADPLAPLAARRLILAQMVRQREQLDTLETLDELHALAQAQGIVTPYSSMIVLVNTSQEILLKRLSEGDDRFVREYEGVGETPDFTVAGVPEPEEWLLLLVAAGLFIWYLRSGQQQKQAKARRGPTAI